MTDKTKILNIGEATVEPAGGTLLRVTLGDKTTDVEYRDLWAALFLLGDEERKDAMMPVQKKEMMIFSRKHQIQATKDVKQGEMINVWCEVNIPQVVVAAIAEKNGAKVILQSGEELRQHESEEGALSPHGADAGKKDESEDPLRTD